MLKIAVSLLFGAMCGSFAAVVADRVPRAEHVVIGRSRCRSCSDVISGRDLVPVLSWLVLGGRCRSCGERIDTTSTFVEIVTAVLFVSCAIVFESPLVVFAHWILCTGLMALSVIDVQTFRLPRRIVHTTALVGAPVLTAAAVSIRQPERLLTAVLGSVFALAGMLVLYVSSRGRLGDGDVRLSALLGLYLGWQDLRAVASGLYVAFCLGAIGGIVALLVTRSKKGRVLPFGPYLAAGTLLTVLLDIDVLG